MYSLFRTFRRTRAWKQHVSGGVAFFEVTINPETRRWHPHFHLICQGSFWKLADLRAAWLAHTGDSHIVDIQSVEDFDRVTAYVVKYASKGFDPTIWRSESALSEAIEALSNVKLIFSFGSFTRLKLLKKPESDANWLPVEPAHRLIRRALAGDSAAETLCRRLWGRRWVEYTGRTYQCSDTS
jgi:hypothetical protein